MRGSLDPVDVLPQPSLKRKKTKPFLASVLSSLGTWFPFVGHSSGPRPCQPSPPKRWSSALRLLAPATSSKSSKRVFGANAKRTRLLSLRLNGRRSLRAGLRVAIGENRFFFSSRNGVSGMEPHHSTMVNARRRQANQRTEPLGTARSSQTCRTDWIPFESPSHSDKRRRLLRPSKLVGRPRLVKGTEHC